MSYYQQPEKELSPEEKPLAAVISVNHRIPCGFQIGMPLHLDAALFAQHCDCLMQQVIRQVDSTIKRH